ADLGLGQDAAALDEDLVGAVDHDLAHRAVVEQAVERAVADGGAQDDVGEGRLLLRVQGDVVIQQEAVEVRAHRAREGDRVAGRQTDVADQREAVAKIVGELVEVPALPGGRLEEVRAPASRRAGRGWRRRGGRDGSCSEYRGNPSPAIVRASDSPSSRPPSSLWTTALSRRGRVSSGWPGGSTVVTSLMSLEPGRMLAPGFDRAPSLNDRGSSPESLRWAPPVEDPLRAGHALGDAL